MTPAWLKVMDLWPPDHGSGGLGHREWFAGHVLLKLAASVKH
jgi:hypothetical protein